MARRPARTAAALAAQRVGVADPAAAAVASPAAAVSEAAARCSVVMMGSPPAHGRGAPLEHRDPRRAGLDVRAARVEPHADPAFGVWLGSKLTRWK